MQLRSIRQAAYRWADRLRQWWRYPQPGRAGRAVGRFTDCVSIEYAAQWQAAKESAAYAAAHMRTAEVFETDYDLREWVAGQVSADLPYVLEFGVAGGRSVNQIARALPGRKVYGFDSFAGLPEAWRWRMGKGAFETAVPRVRKNVQLVAELFQETVPLWLQHHPAPIGLLHVDVDLFSSAETVLRGLVSRLKPGSLIVFDEYLNYPGWHMDEFRAWQELVTEHRVQYEYIALVPRHQQVAIRITKI